MAPALILPYQGTVSIMFDTGVLVAGRGILNTKTGVSDRGLTQRIRFNTRTWPFNTAIQNKSIQPIETNTYRTLSDQCIGSPIEIVGKPAFYRQNRYCFYLIVRPLGAHPRQGSFAVAHSLIHRSQDVNEAYLGKIRLYTSFPPGMRPCRPQGYPSRILTG